MTWLIYFIAGWFGSYWWPGIEVDAPRPGGGDPWWMRLVAGVIAGGVAVYVVGAVAMADAMPAMLLSIATGCVVGKLIGGAMGMMRK
jgi:O-antigen ligase